MLPFRSPYQEVSEVFQRHTQKISISGVQVKYSLRLENNTLRLTETGGQYILKPIPVGTFRHLDQVPANEHLTMQIARQAFNVPVPPNALISFQDGSPAYLVRRFDRTAGKKLPQEDFAQIARMTSETHGENYKYDLSYEEVASLIQRYIPAYRVEIEKFFRLILFNYVFSNGDAHLKNFSVVQSEQGDYLLAPGYDLLCTRIHAPYESDIALTLFKDGFTETYEAYGFYTYQDFYQFGQQIGIKGSRVKGIIQKFTRSKKIIPSLIDRSSLSLDTKVAYRKHYEDKVKRLGMNMT